MPASRIAVVGASADRRKFGNKCVRAFAAAGWTVFPVHPTEASVEGLPAFKSVADIPGGVDVVSVYLNPKVGVGVLPTFAGAKEVWFNPGADSDEVLAKAKVLGLKAVAACSIVGKGMNPHDFGDE
jgi:predicted CoA-binding protein